MAVGDRVEINKEGWEITRMIGEMIEGKVVDQKRGERGQADASDVQGAGGVGLIVDYGDEKAFDNSFRVSWPCHLYHKERTELMQHRVRCLRTRPLEDTRSCTFSMTRAVPT